MSARDIRHLAFLTPGSYAEDDPSAGLEDALAGITLGERLGYDGAWVRQRHLERGISSAATFLAAATQRSRRIELGTAVIPIGLESPFRLAEDLSLVDVLSGGRLQVGLSAGRPQHLDLIGRLAFDGDWRAVDFSHERVLRLAEALRGGFLRPEDARIDVPGGTIRPRLRPHARGLTERLWYGGGSLRSADWAGRHGFHLLLSNVTTGEDTDDFAAAQAAQLAAYRAAQEGKQPGRVALGRVIVPTDSADAATRERYADYAAARHPRTLQPNGPRRILFHRDYVGPSEDILAALAADPIVTEVDELRLELPYDFPARDYEQILTDFVTRIAPVLGWRPAQAA